MDRIGLAHRFFGGYGETMTPTILIVEDEPSIADALIYVLRTEGFRPLHVGTLQAAREKIESEDISLIVLDVGLPDGTGFDFCKEVRAGQSGNPRNREVPILFLTSRSQEIDRIVGLEIGGDDYVTKPFSPREISARAKVILRRSQPLRAPKSAQSLPHEFKIDDEKKRISLRGRPLELSRYEYGLLKLLIENPGRVYSRAQLMDAVWTEPEMSEDRTVDAHVKLLRQKLREAAPDEDYIVTHRGLGYSLRDRA